MSRTLLAERLRQLEENGIVVRKTQPNESGCEYWLTRSGEAFHDVLRDLSRWGLAHARDRLTADDLNPGLLMWRMRKRADISALPERRQSLPKRDVRLTSVYPSISDMILQRCTRR